MNELPYPRSMSRDEKVLLDIIRKMNGFAGDGSLSEGDLQQGISSEVPKSIIRAILVNLERSGFLDRKIDTYPLGSKATPQGYWVLTSKGVDFWENTKDTVRTVAPAADRFVSFDDNSRELLDVRSAVESLREAIRGANGLFADPDERLLISKEIDYFRELVSEQKIHAVALWDVANNNATLKFLAKQTAVVVVRDTAAKVLELLHILIRYILK